MWIDTTCPIGSAPADFGIAHVCCIRQAPPKEPVAAGNNNQWVHRATCLAQHPARPARTLQCTLPGLGKSYPVCLPHSMRQLLCVLNPFYTPTLMISQRDASTVTPAGPWPGTDTACGSPHAYTVPSGLGYSSGSTDLQTEAHTRVLLCCVEMQAGYSSYYLHA
jgi:hypothetical protein